MYKSREIVSISMDTSIPVYPLPIFNSVSTWPVLFHLLLAVYFYNLVYFLKQIPDIICFIGKTSVKTIAMAKTKQ